MLIIGLSLQPLLYIIAQNYNKLVNSQNALHFNIIVTNKSRKSTPTQNFIYNIDMLLV